MAAVLFFQVLWLWGHRTYSFVEAIETMFDATCRSEGMPHGKLVVILVTSRSGMVERLRLAANSMGPHGVELEVHSNLRQAFALLSPTREAILIVDDTVGTAEMSGLPSACARRYPKLRLVLVADHLDPMFRRSALKIGYWHCSSLHEAMRADFLEKLKSMPTQINGEVRQEPDYASRFAASESAHVVANERGRIRYANPAFYRAVGLLTCDLRGVNLSSFFPELSPSALEGHLTNQHRLLELRRASGNQEMVGVTFSSDEEGIVLSF